MDVGTRQKKSGEKLLVDLWACTDSPLHLKSRGPTCPEGLLKFALRYSRGLVAPSTNPAFVSVRPGFFVSFPSSAAGSAAFILEQYRVLGWATLLLLSF